MPRGPLERKRGGSRGVLAALATAGALILPIACDATVAESSQGGDSPAPANDAPAGGDTTTSGGSSGGDATAPNADVRGDPLCHVGPDDCMPDDDATHHANGTASCASAADDGGVAPAPAPAACRLQKGDAPQCLVGGAGSGGDGAVCATGDDCGAGFDCVEGDKTNVCRRYCCLGTCEGQLSQNAGPTFCDIQKLVATADKAPVCMPLKRCTLLQAEDCSQNETCVVADEAGDTGCVTIGDAQVGGACDEDHCAADLTCLGQPGNRRCYQLCHVGAGGCPANQTCETSTVFKDTSFGICQPTTM